MSNAVWECKIGEVDRDLLPSGADLPMRKAIAKAYRELTGKDATFIFSGWGSQLTEYERELVDHG